MVIFMYVGREVECREEVLEGVLSLPPKGPTCVHTESATGGTHITHSQHFKDELTGDCYRQGERCCWCAGRLAQGIVILVLNNLYSCTSANSPNFPLQIPDTSFPSVSTDNQLE
jgi:hypothetical protein